MNKLKQSLEWRYATKRMNHTAVNIEKVNRIIEAIKLTPTSYGMQPFVIINVSDTEWRKKIHESGACTQPQILEGSNILVFATLKNYSEENVHNYIRAISQGRDTPIEALNGFKDMLINFTKNISDSDYKIWAQKQAYIGLGFGLVAAALEEVDSTPMEGFIPAKLDEVLGLSDRGLESCVLLALGYRDEENDRLAQAKKIRREIEIKL
jgi:nitroreductase